jgi:hypothetical protein
MKLGIGPPPLPALMRGTPLEGRFIWGAVLVLGGPTTL